MQLHHSAQPDPSSNQRMKELTVTGSCSSYLNRRPEIGELPCAWKLAGEKGFNGTARQHHPLLFQATATVLAPWLQQQQSIKRKEEEEWTLTDVGRDLHLLQSKEDSDRGQKWHCRGGYHCQELKT